MTPRPPEISSWIHLSGVHGRGGISEGLDYHRSLVQPRRNLSMDLEVALRHSVLAMGKTWLASDAAEKASPLGRVPNAGWSIYIAEFQTITRLGKPPPHTRRQKHQQWHAFHYQRTLGNWRAGTSINMVSNDNDTPATPKLGNCSSSIGVDTDSNNDDSSTVTGPICWSGLPHPSWTVEVDCIYKWFPEYFTENENVMSWKSCMP